MKWKSESLALVFGMLIILIIFGDAAWVSGVGNLDTIFGQTYFPLMDILYPLASIVVFLLYGKSKGNHHFRRYSILLFLGFLVALIIMIFDDFVNIPHHIAYDILHNSAMEEQFTLPAIYWAIARLLYLFTSITTFFAFGQSCKKTND